MSDETPPPTSDDAPTVAQLATERDDGFDFDLDGELPPPPPRRRRLPLVTATLGLCAAVGLGIVFGILIQKHWGGGSGGGGSGRAAALAAALAGRSGQTGTTGTTGTGRGSGAGAFSRAGTVGQVKAIDGSTLYVTDFQGNTVKVTTSPGVRIRVTNETTLKKINPGDYVTIQGTQTASGYAATSITDSGSESPVGGGLGGLLRQSGGSGASGSTGTQPGAGSSSSVPALPGLGG